MRDEPYRPSCGAEGLDFMDAWCARCVHDQAYRRDEGDSCMIVANALAFDVDDPLYPVEWVENDAGPRCTAFVEAADA